MTTPTPWLPFAGERPGARVRLFCLPYAGGSASIYRRWNNYMPEFIAVHPIELPGRGTRMQEPPYTDLSLLVADMTLALHASLDKPFALFGHSMGGLIGFELVRKLRREYGLAPVYLFISGHEAPHFEDPLRSSLPEDELLAELRRLNGTPKEVLASPELLAIVLPLLRADFAVCESYAHDAEPPLACPIAIFGGTEDMLVEREKLEAWRDYTSGDFSLRLIPGDHFFIHTAETFLLRSIAAKLFMLNRSA